MAFNILNTEVWPRKEYFNHFTNDIPCSYSVTVELDISAVGSQKLYPAMLWLLTSTVNEFNEFRTHLSDVGVGIFDSMHPKYTIFNPDTKTFSVIYTEFCQAYDEFLMRYTEDTAKYKNSTKMFPKPGMPDNTFDVSMIPWLKFSAFNLNINISGTYLLPIFTLGQSYKQNQKTFLPLAIQVHHAVCDGYHVAMFVKALSSKLAEFKRV